ncbi:hypothetical protein SLS60_002609 [Paraconiothyrium brasiliense]|uniref:G protein-coupled receptor GPR1/2/3 C-terminal domain-containing protein n=1 Tax=Paraconiothyrium brasiliense TaxID=300254 RepID=A0ABR3RTA8_9PLEO
MVELATRTALSAPAAPHQIQVLNEAILAVSVLSMAGAGWIILSFCLFKEVRTFRHQLILGLAISDFFMAFNFLSSFNGFMTQFFVVQTDYWVMTIAIWCWFGSDKTRLLVNFVPRWVIIIAMLGLYIRLYRIIYRAHEQFISFQDESSSRGLPDISSEIENSSSTRRIGRPSASMHVISKDGTIEVERHGTNRQTHAGRPSSVLKKLAKQMMYYPLAYMLIWTIPTSIRIYQSVRGVPAPFGIATVDKACIVIQGFVDAIIYGLNESSKAVWRNKFRRSPPVMEVTPIQVNVEHEIRVERLSTIHTESGRSSVHIV